MIKPDRTFIIMQHKMTGSTQSVNYPITDISKVVINKHQEGKWRVSL